MSEELTEDRKALICWLVKSLDILEANQLLIRDRNGNLVIPIAKMQFALSNEKPPKKPKAKPFELPEWVDREAWNAFEEMRKKIKAPLTDYARHMAVKDLEKLLGNGQDPKDILDQSTVKCWRGLFPVKPQDVVEIDRPQAPNVLERVRSQREGD